jgi:hypothetical protein
MLRSGALTAPGSAILSCRINHDKSYAFIEFRCVAQPAARGALRWAPACRKCRAGLAAARATR